MDQTTYTTTKAHELIAQNQNQNQHTIVAGGLPVRTDLHAGLSWDDPSSSSQDIGALLRLLDNIKQ